jgi:hypothetical protein
MDASGRLVPCRHVEAPNARLDPILVQVYNVVRLYERCNASVQARYRDWLRAVATVSSCATSPAMRLNACCKLHATRGSKTGGQCTRTAERYQWRDVGTRLRGSRARAGWAQRLSTGQLVDNPVMQPSLDVRSLSRVTAAQHRAGTDEFVYKMASRRFHLSGRTTTEQFNPAEHHCNADAMSRPCLARRICVHFPGTAPEQSVACRLLKPVRLTF